MEAFLLEKQDGQNMRLTRVIFMPFLFLFIALSAGAPDEATGRVIHVTDGDTFDVQLLNHDGRISEDVIRIRLADLDAPEIFLGGRSFLMANKAQKLGEIIASHALSRHESMKLALYLDSMPLEVLD